MALVRSVLLGIVAALLVGATPAPVPLQPWEHGGVQVQINRVRMLSQRLGKENLLHQLNLAGRQRSDLVETAGRIDATLEVLMKGSPGLSVPAPPDMEIRRSLQELDAAWGALRRVAVASSYEYVRQAAERGASDPLGIQYFDGLVADVDAAASRTSEAYVGLCEAQGRRDCRAVAGATASGMLTERMMRELVLVASGMDAAANGKRLAESRQRFGQALAQAGAQEPVRATMASERGKPGRVAAGMWSDIQASWAGLGSYIDQAIAGEGERVDLGAALVQQQDLLHELQRLSVAVRRFAALRRASGGGPAS